MTRQVLAVGQALWPLFVDPDELPDTWINWTPATTGTPPGADMRVKCSSCNRTITELWPTKRRQRPNIALTVRPDETGNPSKLDATCACGKRHLVSLQRLIERGHRIHRAGGRDVLLA